MRKLIGLLVLAFAGLANAATWDDSNNTIRGLEVGGSSYDVSFGWTSYDLAHDAAKERIVYWANHDDALIAANTVNSFLTEEGVREVSSSGNNQTNFVAYDVNDQSAAPLTPVTGVLSGNGNVTYPTPPDWEVISDPYTTSSLTQYTGWTDVSEVPIPAAAWLFGSALLGLGVIKRKRA